jgi:hypothetical protein
MILETLRALPGPEDLYSDELKPFVEVERKKKRDARIHALCEELARHESEQADSEADREAARDQGCRPSVRPLTRPSMARTCRTDRPPQRKAIGLTAG